MTDILIRVRDESTVMQLSSVLSPPTCSAHKVAAPSMGWLVPITAFVLALGSVMPVMAEEPSGLNAPQQPPTSVKIKGACALDHVKYCPNSAGGTPLDIGCLQQHHVSLKPSCRNILGQIPARNGLTSVNRNR